MFFSCVCVCFVKDQAMLWTVIVQGEVEAVLCQSSGQGSTPGCDTDRAMDNFKRLLYFVAKVVDDSCEISEQKKNLGSLML